MISCVCVCVFLLIIVAIIELKHAVLKAPVFFKLMTEEYLHGFHLVSVVLKQTAEKNWLSKEI